MGDHTGQNQFGLSTASNNEYITLLSNTGMWWTEVDNRQNDRRPRGGVRGGNRDMTPLQHIQVTTKNCA